MLVPTHLAELYDIDSRLDRQAEMLSRLLAEVASIRSDVADVRDELTDARAELTVIRETTHGHTKVLDALVRNTRN